MIRSVLPWKFALGVALASGSGSGHAWAQEPRPELARLQAHVMTLASPEFAGRRDAGAVRSRAYLIEAFQKLGLAPLFDGSFTQNVTGTGPDDVLGVNVGARIVGTDPALADRWVILGAHYDHLGTAGGVVYPGADDNASGVAMMLEVARAIAGSPDQPRRSVAFVGFDLEERGPRGEFGLRGSQFFARHAPVPLEKVNLFVTADMIGRSLGGVCGPVVFVLGSEREPEVRPWIARGAVNQPIEVALLGSDVLLIDRSDYGPFRSRKIPYLFFTTGESPVYHSPNDRPETIDYPKLEAISQLIHSVVGEAVRGKIDPVWSTRPDYPIAEPLAIRSVFQTLLAHRERLRITDYQTSQMTRTITTIDGIETRKAMTPAERNSIVRTAQLILFTVF